MRGKERFAENSGKVFSYSKERSENNTFSFTWKWTHKPFSQLLTAIVCFEKNYEGKVSTYGIREMKLEIFFSSAWNSFQCTTSRYMSSLMLSQSETDFNYLLTDICPNMWICIPLFLPLCFLLQLVFPRFRHFFLISIILSFPMSLIVGIISHITIPRNNYNISV